MEKFLLLHSKVNFDLKVLPVTQFATGLHGRRLFVEELNMYHSLRHTQKIFLIAIPVS